jgi:two-component system, cell cycle response regulator
MSDNTPLEEIESHLAIHSMYEKKIAEIERRVYDLKNLINLGMSLSSNLDFESLVESILYSCIGQVVVDKVVILLQADIDETNFYIHMTKGYDDTEVTSETLFDDSSEFVKYFNNNPAVVEMAELAQLPQLSNDLKKLSGLNAKIVIPMKSKELLNGFIFLGEKLTGEEFTDNEKEFLEDLARFAATAVENSRLYLMATLDRMTRLFIHHYFQERLSDELKRLQRHGTPVTLIMSDIDHFKRFNDTYGHQQGDIVLKEVAMIFKKYVRTTDLPARYGGEEFAVILPDTTLEKGIEIASRLRKAIEEHEFTGQAEPLHVTMSLGVAQYNEELDKEKKDFIERADSALYKAKETGRNRVVAHKSE